jgi:hypothetical protein
MILDSGDDSLIHSSLGFLGWRMHSRYESHIFVIRVAQYQHGGPFAEVAWDPETSWFDNLTVGTDGGVNFYYHEFISIGIGPNF